MNSTSYGSIKVLFAEIERLPDQCPSLPWCELLFGFVNVLFKPYAGSIE
jgi:hypothetical protein